MSDERPTHLDLFSGIGGFAFAAEWAGFRTIAFCEIDPYCQKVLAKNFPADTESERWREGRTESNGTRPTSTGVDRIPIFSNIFDFDGTAYRGSDLLTGGFPCQPFSIAGKRRGATDDRHLWPEMLRVIDQARPTWIVGENVAGIVQMELDNVLSDLESIGYATRPFVIPACAVDARHRRDRLWIVCRDVSGQSKIAEFRNGSALVESNGAGLEFAQEVHERSGKLSEGKSVGRTAGCPSRWLPEPDVGRVAHGIPARVDRLKGLGNAIVPQVAFEILKEIRRMI